MEQLSVPAGAWKEVAVDFVVELPRRSTVQEHNDGNRSIDKAASPHPRNRMDAYSAAKLFHRHASRHHGLPDSITSDRGAQFTSTLWRRLCERLNVKAKMSTAFHPQSDGQSENTIKLWSSTFEATLTTSRMIGPNGSPLCGVRREQYSVRTTRVTPFYANSGRHPRFGVEPAVAPHL